MSVYQTSEADVASLFSKKVGVTIPEADLIFSAPKVNDNPAHPENSQIRLTVKPTNATYKGSEVFFYNRLDLAHLASYPAPDYPPVSPQGTSVYALLQAIKNSAGISFTTNDLVETFVQGDDPNMTILLKAKDTSVGWIGEFNLPLGVRPLLSSIFVRDTITWS